MRRLWTAPHKIQTWRVRPLCLRALYDQHLGASFDLPGSIKYRVYAIGHVYYSISCLRQDENNFLLVGRRLDPSEML